MNIVSLQDLKIKGSKALSDDEPNFLAIDSEVKFVIISIKEYEMLIEALEDIEDIEVAREYERSKRNSFGKSL